MTMTCLSTKPRIQLLYLRTIDKMNLPALLGRPRNLILVEQVSPLKAKPRQPTYKSKAVAAMFTSLTAAFGKFGVELPDHNEEDIPAMLAANANFDNQPDTHTLPQHRKLHLAMWRSKLRSKSSNWRSHTATRS